MIKGENTMDYRLTHVGLLCRDNEKSIPVYTDQLDGQVTTRAYNKGQSDLTFIGKGTDVTIELVNADPFLPYEQKFIDKHGFGINHVSFQVDDADAAFEDLKSQGVTVAWEPKHILFVRQCGFYDPDGLLIEIYSYPTEEEYSLPDVVKPLSPTNLTFHHVSLITDDLERSERFYVEKLGMKRAAECFEESGGGFIFLIDPFFDGEQHNVMFEIIVGPDLWEREQVLLDKHGPLFDHICYMAKDVPGAYKELLAKGATDNMEAHIAYGLTMAWIRDADGVEIELMSPFPGDMQQKILRGEIPVAFPE
jgi:catechol 2,3-dioxygenase-like lactoylglutathione lyase family enzyme